MTVHILFSCSLNKYYVGQTSDFSDRFQRHNKGHEKYTKTGIPWKLIWNIEVLTRSEAMKLERKIKKRGAKRFLQGISL